MKKSSSPGVLPLTFGLWCIGVIPPQRSCHRRGFIINPSKLAGPSFLCFHHHVATPVEQLRFSRCAHPRWYPMKFCQGSMIPVFLMDRWRWKRLSHATRIYIDALFFFPEILSGSRKGKGMTTTRWRLDIRGIIIISYHSKTHEGAGFEWPFQPRWFWMLADVSRNFSLELFGVW